MRSETKKCVFCNRVKRIRFFTKHQKKSPEPLCETCEKGRKRLAQDPVANGKLKSCFADHLKGFIEVVEESLQQHKDPIYTCVHAKAITNKNPDDEEKIYISICFLRIHLHPDTTFVIYTYDSRGVFDYMCKFHGYSYFIFPNTIQLGKEIKVEGCIRCDVQFRSIKYVEFDWNNGALIGGPIYQVPKFKIVPEPPKQKSSIESDVTTVESDKSEQKIETIEDINCTN